MRSTDITHVVFGDIMGDTHREWNERVCARNGLTPVMPLWAQPTLLLVREFIARGGDARFVTVGRRCSTNRGSATSSTRQRWPASKRSASIRAVSSASITPS